MNYILILVEGEVDNSTELSVLLNGKEVLKAVPITIKKEDYLLASAESLGLLVQKMISAMQ